MSFQCIRGDLTQSMPITLAVNDIAVVIADTSTVELRWTDPDGVTTVVALEEVDFATGQVRRVWVAGDTDVVGAHTGQIIVTSVGGDVETFPNDGSLIIWWVYPRTGDDC